ncbi:transposase [Streptomyces minutiscleroticus]|uniref:transposase n=1 Tax=Streptomyces minutiscleroticus TaxID=68238 RepID=UPI0033167614
MITEVVPAPASAHRTRWSRTPRDDPTRAANTQGPWAPPSKYSSEFKEDAVRIVLQSGKTISETARELGLNENTYWCSLDGPVLFDGRGPAGSSGDSENTCRKAFR